MSYSKLFSKRATAIKSSVIREILKVTANPQVISFAGGLPAPESFPVAQMKAAFDKVLATDAQAALQYSTTDGYAPLREWVANRMSTNGATITADQVIIVSGSQQALDLIGKVFIDEGDKVLVETPTYLGALQAFSLFSPEFISSCLMRMVWMHRSCHLRMHKRRNFYMHCRTFKIQPVA